MLRGPIPRSIVRKWSKIYTSSSSIWLNRICQRSALTPHPANINGWWRGILISSRRCRDDGKSQAKELEDTHKDEKDSSVLEKGTSQSQSSTVVEKKKEEGEQNDEKKGNYNEEEGESSREDTRKGAALA